MHQTSNTAGLVTAFIKAIAVVIAGSDILARIWGLTIFGKKVSADPHFPFAYSFK